MSGVRILTVVVGLVVMLADNIQTLSGLTDAGRANREVLPKVYGTLWAVPHFQYTDGCNLVPLLTIMCITAWIDNPWAQLYTFLSLSWMLAYCLAIGALMVAFQIPPYGAPLFLLACVGMWPLYKMITDPDFGLYEKCKGIIVAWLGYLFFWFGIVSSALIIMRKDSVSHCLKLASQLMLHQPQEWPRDGGFPSNFVAQPPDLVASCHVEDAQIVHCPLLLVEVLLILPFLVAFWAKSRLDSNVGTESERLMKALMREQAAINNQFV